MWSRRTGTDQITQANQITIHYIYTDTLHKLLQLNCNMPTPNSSPNANANPNPNANPNANTNKSPNESAAFKARYRVTERR